MIIHLSFLTFLAVKINFEIITSFEIAVLVVSSVIAVLAELENAAKNSYNSQVK